MGWYASCKRDLPFRRTRDPYRVWLSEIMLQQTTVKTALPYYGRFLAEFPDVGSVARSSEERLLALWQGLGYYSRARHFREACGELVSRHGGNIPRESATLKNLKGVGDYTAAAIASIAFDEPVAVVDGNVRRVLARLYAYGRDAGSGAAERFFRAKADRLLDAEAPGDFNQALMELGATVCRPRNPACAVCPVAAFCAARDSDPLRFSSRRRARYVDWPCVAVIVADASGLWLRPPGPDSMVRGLWELPWWRGKVPPSLPPGEWPDPSLLAEIARVRHAIMNRRITARIYAFPDGPRPALPYRFVTWKRFELLPVGTLSRKAVEAYVKACGSGPRAERRCRTISDGSS